MKKFIIILLFIASITMHVYGQQLFIVPTVQNWNYIGENIEFNSIKVVWDKDISDKENLFFNRFIQELDAIYHPNKNVNQKILTINFDTHYTSIIAYKDAYKIEIRNEIGVKASSYKGLVYATRTLLQLLSQQQYKKTLPKGTIVDYPLYQKRMLLLDVARKFFTIDELKDFVRIMAWVKMNELHLHLSDNSWGGYSAYRLKSKKYPELTAKDGHYSWEEIHELQEFANSYGITITPEIDSPGHSRAFTIIRPDLENKLLGPNYLDILNPDTYTFMEDILEEVIPHFDAPDFHIGTDEYRINKIKNDSLKRVVGDAFRNYINYFNKVVKNNGKTARIWSGFEHMPGKTAIDKDIIIDMWETSDARDKSEKGYKFINSSHYYTYIVPGAPYYGVDNKFVYNKWTPEIFSDKSEQNLTKNSKGLLGSKLHIWNDFGPTGYNITEIARLSTPSIFVFSGKMWGTKSKLPYKDYCKQFKKLLKIPLTSLLNREFEDKKIIYQNDKNIILSSDKVVYINSEYENLEYPWSLEMTLTKTKLGSGKEVLLSSNIATVYSDLVFDFKKKKQTITKRGFAIVRANQTAGETPLTAFRPQVIVFDYKIPINKEIKIKLVGEKQKTSLFVDNKLIGSQSIQMLCPTDKIGSIKENSFNGVIKNIRITKERAK